MWSWLRRPRTGSPARTRLRFVPVVTELEPRLALAGNVTAVVSRGDLIVRGDDAGATLTLSQPAAGQVTITGDNTTVNGLAGPVTLPGVTRNLRVYFGAGDDSLTFDADAPLTLSGDVSVEGGGGSNTVSVDEVGPLFAAAGAAGALNVGGDLTVHNLSGGTQQIRLEGLNVRGDVRVVNLGGDALTSIESFGGPNVIGGDLLIANGPGQFDQTELRSVQVGRDVRVENQGQDALTTVDSFDGSNTIRGGLAVIDGPGQLAQTMIGGTRVGHGLRVIEKGSEQNIILVLSSRVGGKTDLRTGGGGATVFVNGTTFGGAFRLRTGDEADAVAVGTRGIVTLARLVAEEVVIIQNGVPVVVTRLKLVPEQILAAGAPVTFRGKVKMDLGDGADALRLALDAFVTFEKEATLDGGRGDNTAAVRFANLPALPTFRHFQVTSI
jgi:hypothetical protein